MGVKEYYYGKNLLLTGATGFLGKVILEKILRTIPEIGTIYLLIRKKEGASIIERLKKSVIESPCFEKLRKLHKNFDEFILSKVIPISGDLEKEGLSLSNEDRELLIHNVNFIINCAATVDFNARLDESIKINIRGPLRVLELAKQIKNLENFVHISTAYVNSDKRGGIQERIYPIDVNPELLIKDIESIPSTQIEARTASIIGNFPNTYTFTKSMSERILEKHRGTVPMTIVRPTIIGCSWKEPFPGWVDTVSAAGALYLLGGIGLVKVCKGDPMVVGDQIPVDICSDTIIVATALYANQKDITIIHCGTSATNPVSWGYSMEVIKSYWIENPPEKRLGPCVFRLEKNDKKLKFEQKTRILPVMAFQRLAGLFDNTQMKKKSNKLFKALKRAEQLSDLFQHFTMNEWIYMTSHIEEMENYLTPEERKLFNLNPKDIQWKKYLLYFAWGLRYFILKEQCDVPAQGDRADLLTSTGAHRVSTLKWLFSRGFDFKPTETAIIKQKIMASNRVRNVIRDIVVNRSTNMSDSEFEAYLTKVAEKNCDFILSTYDIKWIRFTGLIIHTALKKIYEKIVVDEKALEKIRQYDQKKNGPLIFMPTHRSYLDFILVSYIFYTFSIKCPHIVAAEDFLGIALVHHLLRGSGALFIRRKKVEYMEIYWAVLYEYIQTLLIDESWLEFFIEGTRSRYGKTLAPKLGILNMVCDTVFDNKIPNAHILPITMSYERVIEGEAYPLELLGEEKKKESLGRLIGALNILAMNFGRVYVEFCDTISIKQYAEDFMEKSGHTKNPYTNSKDREALVHSLGYEVVYRLNENLIIMPTAIVSSLLLLHRKGISEEMLMQKVEWLKNQILERGGRIGGIDENSSLKTIKGAITHLQHLVEQKKDIVHLQVSAKSDYKNVLMLAYYRNMLLHVFWHECLVACALSSFGQEIAWKEGLSAERLWEELSFLAELMSREVHLRTPITKSNYMSLINAMVDRKVLSYKDNKIRVVDDLMMAYLCNLIWPFVESYWVCSVYMFSLKNRTTPTYEKKFSQEVQMFTESMYEERIIEFYEACSIDTIKNAVSIFKKWKLLNSNKKMLEKGLSEPSIELAITEDALNLVQDHIRRFLKNSFAKSVNSPIELARKTMLIDYPFMAKM